MLGTKGQVYDFRFVTKILIGSVNSQFERYDLLSTTNDKINNDFALKHAPHRSLKTAWVPQ